MTETRTATFELPQYSAGTDSTLSRADTNEAFGNIEQRAAYDDGTTASSLPAAKKAGAYFRRSFVDGYALYRQHGTDWEEMGGTVRQTRVRMRGAVSGDIMLSSDVDGGAATATWKAGGEFATSGLLRSSAGLGVGASLATDLSTPSSTGRAYMRTVADGDRALVLQAHHDNAGALFTARVAGGSDPLTIDSRGRLRASAPIGLGQSSPATNIPAAISPGGSDVTALDLYAEATGPIPALRIFRDNGDVATPIASFLPDAITLGRSSWSGASITLRAPTLTLVGAAAVTGSLSVSDDLTVTDTFTAENGKIATYESGSNFGMSSQVVPNGGGTATRDLRHSLVHRKRILNINKTISATSAADLHTFDFVPRTTCSLDLNLGCHFTVFDPGAASADSEPNTVLFRLRILDDNDNVLFTGDEIYELTMTVWDGADYVGKGQIAVIDCPTIILTAGTTYQIQLYGRRDPATSISLVLKHVVGTIREGVLIGT